MNSFKKTSKIVFAFLFLFVLTACTRPTGGIPNSSDVELSQVEDENIDLKLKYYSANCINLFSGQMKLLQQDYVKVMNPELGPENEENVPSLFVLDSTQDCALAIAQAKELNLAQELDPLAENYLSTLQNAAPLIAQATRYYDQMDYKTDDFEKGKELHPKLMVAFEDFEKADANFKKSIQQIQTSINLRFLESYKKAGLNFEFLVQDAWIKGTALLNKAEAEAYDTLDTEDYTKAVNEYQAALEALEAYLLEHPEQAALAEVFQEGAWEYMDEAKQLMSRKREGLPYDQLEGNANLMRNQYEWWQDDYFL